MDRKTVYHPHARWRQEYDLHMRIRKWDEDWEDDPEERQIRHMDLEGVMN
jgi:hypothetical protein